MTPTADPAADRTTEPTVVPAARPGSRGSAGVATATGVGFALLAALLAGAAPRPVLLVVVLPVQLLLATVWITLAAVPARRGGVTIAGGAALSADLLLVCRSTSGVGALAGVVGVGVVAAVVGQLVRRERARVTDVLAAHCSAVLLAVAVSPTLAVPVLHRGDQLVVTAMVTVALTLTASEVGAVVVPAHRLLARAGSGLVVGVGVGCALGAVILGSAGVAVAAATSLATAVAELVAALVAADRRLARPYAALSAFAFAAPGLYVVGRVMLG